jgi:hypothetical protein
LFYFWPPGGPSKTPCNAGNILYFWTRQRIVRVLNNMLSVITFPGSLGNVTKVIQRQERERDTGHVML